MFNSNQAIKVDNKENNTSMKPPAIVVTVVVFLLLPLTMKTVKEMESLFTDNKMFLSFCLEAS